MSMKHERASVILCAFASLFVIIFLRAPGEDYIVYGNPDASLTHVYVTHGNGIIDLVGGGHVHAASYSSNLPLHDTVFSRGSAG